MNRIRVLALFLFFNFLIGSLVAAPAPELIRKRAMADLDCIRNMFEVKYAPKEWKREFAKWDLNVSIQQAKNRIKSLRSPSLKDCQIILRDFFNSTKDYHVGVRFFSTEAATLPFLVKSAGERYFICYVDQAHLDSSPFPFEEGDEILMFGGKPIHSVVVELRNRELGSNVLETDHALAEIALTQRRGSLGHMIPQGEVEIVGLKKGSVEPISAKRAWNYSPEKIRDYSKLGTEIGFQTFLEIQERGESEQALLRKNPFFDKLMIYPMWDQSYTGLLKGSNPHDLGARSSYIPPLGQKLWKSSSDSIFDAYIFATPSGKTVGYIRIPNYMGDVEQVEEFGLIMNFFQQNTDALVIDQINNPGGSVFYLYALAAILTDQPLYAPKHRIAITQEEVYTACSLLSNLETVKDDAEGKKVLGETVGGYPVDYEFVRLMRSFCLFLVNEWNSGKIFSSPTYLFGVDQILPHPNYRYTKPILLLTNALDFSGGDFFPAILQDNQRAKIMGVRTAGAGGYVLPTSYPNHTGIKTFLMTGSIAERKNLRPLENLGVVPDIPYQLTVADLQGNYFEYRQAIVDQLEAL